MCKASDELTELLNWWKINLPSFKEHKMSELTKSEIRNIKTMVSELKDDQKKHNEKHEDHMEKIASAIGSIPRPPYTKKELDKKFNEKAGVRIEKSFERVVNLAITFIVMGILGAIFVPRAWAYLI